jgi:hypothetical protein
MNFLERTIDNEEIFDSKQLLVGQDSWKSDPVKL